MISSLSSFSLLAIRMWTESRTSPGNLLHMRTWRAYLLGPNLHFNKLFKWLSSTLTFSLPEAFDTRLGTPSSLSPQFVFGYSFLISFSCLSFSNSSSLGFCPFCSSCLLWDPQLPQNDDDSHISISLFRDSGFCIQLLSNFASVRQRFKHNISPAESIIFPTPHCCSSSWVSHLDSGHHWLSVLSQILDTLGSSLPALFPPCPISRQTVYSTPDRSVQYQFSSFFLPLLGLRPLLSIIWTIKLAPLCSLTLTSCLYPPVYPTL